MSLGGEVFTDMRRTRSRIVSLVGAAAIFGSLNVFAGDSLERVLGWTSASTVLFLVSAALLLFALWNLLGLIIAHKGGDQESENSSEKKR